MRAAQARILPHSRTRLKSESQTGSSPMTPINRNLLATLAALMTASALQGDGLALARWCLVADDIGRGALVAAGERPVRYERSYWAVWPPRAGHIPGVKAFIAWLQAEAAAFPLPSQAAAR
ncbi:MAG TPA: LysR substrate-binding domain-containing protein [Steroidobacteraceae bacterium]